MKTVLLLAGMGRRLGEVTRTRHKAFIDLDGMPSLCYLLERLINAGATALVPVLGFDSEAVLGLIRDVCHNRIPVIPVHNPDYEKTNNLGSLICARATVAGGAFAVCNGDLVINGNIISDLMKCERPSAIAADDGAHEMPLDSPGIEVIDGRIYDLGRHIPPERSGGYAIGVYKFGADLAPVFFDRAESMFANNRNAGFHDPLIQLFPDHPVFVCSTQGRSWMDIDTKEDIARARGLLEKIRHEERNEK